MTWADLVTALRLASAPFAGWATAAGSWKAAALLLLLAIATDFLDGFLARRLGQASNRGGLFDHGADCLFVTCALGGLASAGWLPWLLPALIPLAFAQYVLDSGALAGQRLRTNAVGKANGIGYFALAGLIVFPQWLGLAWLPMAWTQAAAWLLAASTLVSMTERLAFVLRGRLAAWRSAK